MIASEDTIVDAIDKKFKIEHMLKGINTVLDDREKKIIILRYGLNNCYPKSQQDTADLLGISRSYVSRIEKKKHWRNCANDFKKRRIHEFTGR